jgi:hypothetical protein
VKSSKSSNYFELILLFISFFSILNNGVLELFGIRVYLIIGLFYFITIKPNYFSFNNILTYEFFYFFVLYFIIITFIPYYDKHINERTILQRFDGRYFSQLLRFFLEILASSYFYNLYTKNKDLFIKVLLFATNTSIIIGLVDFIFLGRSIYTYFLGDTHVSYRYTALNIEPRMFGIILVYIFVFLKYQNVTIKKLLPIIFSIFFTISVSSIIIFLISFIYFYRKNIYVIISSILVLLSFIFIILIPNSDSFSLVYDRLVMLSTINNNNDYFSIFSVMEVFDRAALNALFNNKIYLITGFGPNTISIPSSDYIAPDLSTIYDDIINSVPHSGFVNILSRSGVFFLLFYIFSFKKKKNRLFFLIYLLQMNFIFYSFYQILFNKKNINE